MVPPVTPQDLLMEGGGGARFLIGSYPILYGLEGDKIFYSKVLKSFILDYVYPTKYVTHKKVPPGSIATIIYDVI